MSVVCSKLTITVALFIITAVSIWSSQCIFLRVANFGDPIYEGDDINAFFITFIACLLFVGTKDVV